MEKITDIQFYDAFKKNNAPYEMETRTNSFGKDYEIRVYTQDAYKNYMDVSDITGHKIRWVVIKDGKKMSMLSHYGIKAGSNAYNNASKMIAKMTEKERIVFAKYLFPERFKNEDESWDFAKSLNNQTVRLNEPERNIFAINYAGTLDDVVRGKHDDIIEKVIGTILPRIER